ncbi:MAG TPA: hypothetical protein VGJ13_14705 [Pseudonocardiaceae bacterium]
MSDDRGGAAIGAEVLIRAPDRLALVALFSGYLEDGPRYDPKTYAAAAARLGGPQPTVLRRIEHLRTRLVRRLHTLAGFAVMCRSGGPDGRCLRGGGWLTRSLW